MALSLWQDEAFPLVVDIEGGASGAGGAGGACRIAAAQGASVHQILATRPVAYRCLPVAHGRLADVPAVGAVVIGKCFGIKAFQTLDNGVLAHLFDIRSYESAATTIGCAYCRYSCSRFARHWCTCSCGCTCSRFARRGAGPLFFHSICTGRSCVSAQDATVCRE